MTNFKAATARATVGGNNAPHALSHWENNDERGTLNAE
jgi:hypothetical protein